MKLILAVISPTALHAVRAALTALGIGGISVAEALSCNCAEENLTPADLYQHPVSNVTLEIAVTDDDLDRTLDAISEFAYGAQTEAGNILVVNLAQARRVRTGESDDYAL